MARKVQPLIKKGLLKADLHNIDDVNLFLKKLPEAFKRKFLIMILRASAKDFVKSAQRNLNSSVKKGETGQQEKKENQALTDSISVQVLRALGKDRVTVVAKAGSKRSVVKKFPNVQKYAVGIEWGMFGSFPGYGFMRKSYEENKLKVKPEITKKAITMISRAQKRYLKQGRYTIFG
jgi:hypothetical protein